MLPLATNLPPKLTHISGIRCICFDLYGTLFQSAAGGISRQPTQHPDIANILNEPLDFDFEAAKQSRILAEHTRLKEIGHEFPEINIVTIWQDLLLGNILPKTTLQIQQFIRAYQAIQNPTASMPGAAAVLSHLQSMNYQLGIISNAQFYTHDLFQRHLGNHSTQLGFQHEIYSYQYLHAKPGLFLFEQFLQQSHLPAEQILYVGNDMLNDIQPATTVGMKTALFAGDKRSLRLRKNHHLTAEPDAIITELEQIPVLLKSFV